MLPRALLLLLAASLTIAFHSRYTSYRRHAIHIQNYQKAFTSAYPMRTPLYQSPSQSPRVMEFNDVSDDGTGARSEADGEEDKVTRSRRADIMNILSNVIEPDIGSDIVTAEVMKDIIFDGSKGTIDVVIDSSATSYGNEIAEQCVKLLDPYGSLWGVSIGIAQSQSVGSTIGQQVQPSSFTGLSRVKNIIAVSSCKGGVGKSTVSVNLAYTLAKNKEVKVGILDADIYGPSLPTMTKPAQQDVVYADNQIAPLEYEGVKLMSMGYINRGASIMRGPMVNQILNQFVSLTNWGELDYLIVDMPPGTGDIQLTLAQIMNISAAIIVTTPQRLSFVDVVKGIDLFDTVNIPCVAVVENMAEYSTYKFSQEFYRELGEKTAAVAAASGSVEPVIKCIQDAIEAQQTPLRLFGDGHSKRLREMWGIDNLVSLPLLQEVSICGDAGMPYVISNPDSAVSKTMKDLAGGVIDEISRLSEADAAELSNFALDYNENTGMIRYGKYGEILPKALRADCRCATCVEEFTGKSLLDKNSISEKIKPLGMAPIGRYAISVDWSDGHKSLYPFKQITKLVTDTSQKNM